MLASVTVPATPEAYKKPKITYQVGLQQVVTQAVNLLGTSVGENKYARIANVQIEIVAIKKSLVESALTRTFTTIVNYVSTDLNPETRANGYNTIDIAAPPTNTPTLSIDVNTDDTETEEIANIKILITSVKIEFLQSTFDRVKAYVVNSLTTDLNP